MSHRMERAQQRRRGVTAIQVLVLLPALMGFATLTVDVGTIYNAKADMQRTVDAAALAAIGVIAYADPNDANLLTLASDAAVDYAGRNKVLSGTVELDLAEDVTFGRAYYDDVSNSYNFVGGDSPTNAVRISVRHTEDSPNGKLPLFLAGALGSNVTEITADATAIFVGTQYEKADCFDTVPAGSVMMCLHGDSDDSDDSEAGDSDDSDDSSPGDSGSHSSDDSGNTNVGDSESHDSGADSDAGTTIILDKAAMPIFLKKGATSGACNCEPGDIDDSDDSEAGDSSDSDDSDPGDGESDPPAKVTICHIPPGNPANAHTITISANALPAHLAHGDNTGMCPDSSKLHVFLIE